MKLLKRRFENLAASRDQWQQSKLPSPTSVRNWLLRLGLFQLQRPLEKADDWVGIVDHTVQIGDIKCLLIVGLRLKNRRQQEVRTLTYSDVDLVGLWPVRTSTGEVVAEPALTTVTGRTLDQWEKNYLGSTIQSQRKQAFPTIRDRTKSGSNTLAKKSTN